MITENEREHPNHPRHAEHLERRRMLYRLHHAKKRAVQKAWEAANPKKRQAQRDAWLPGDLEARRKYAREYRRMWTAKNKARAKAIAKRAYAKGKENIKRHVTAERKVLKRQMVAEYGGSCACCGESMIEFLSLDHIYNDAKSDALAIGGKKKGRFAGAEFYRRLRRAGWPKDNYQLLCFNCNLAKYHNGGVCPHQTQRLAVAS